MDPSGPLRPPQKIVAKVPRQRTYPRIPRGPKLYTKPVQRVDFPGEPPPGFLSGKLHGSRSEWPIYAGLWKALAVEPKDGYRSPPFSGAPDGSFEYQAWELGGRSQTGGAVADFLVRSAPGGSDLLIRVQSYRFHLTAGPAVTTEDDLQRARLSRDNTVIDIYEEQFLNLTGSELVVFVKSVLGLVQASNPITAGQVRPTR